MSNTPLPGLLSRHKVGESQHAREASSPPRDGRIMNDSREWQEQFEFAQKAVDQFAGHVVEYASEAPAAVEAYEALRPSRRYESLAVVPQREVRSYLKDINNTDLVDEVRHFVGLPDTSGIPDADREFLAAFAESHLEQLLLEL